MKQLFTSQLPQDVRDLLNTLTSEIQGLKKELEEVRQLMAISEADFILLENKVEVIEQNLTTLTQTVTNLETSLSQQISGVQTSANDNILALQQADVAFSNEITNLKQADTDITQLIQTLQGVDTEVTQDITSLEGVDTTVQQTIQSLSSRLAALETNQANISASQISIGQYYVIGDLTLPTTDSYGSTITWASSNEAVISSTGVVTRPDYPETNILVTLTATVTYGEQSTTKEFVREVVATPIADDEKVAEDLTALQADFADLSEATEDLTLPTEGSVRQSTITWTSSDESVIQTDGTVIRPSFTAGDKTVTLTALITSGAASDTATFTLIVPALPISDQEKLDADIVLLSIDDFDEVPEVEGIQVTTSKVMPAAIGTYSSAITWLSDDTTHFSVDGIVTRPAYGEPDALVTLQATVANGTASDVKEFTVIVLAETEAPVVEPPVEEPPAEEPPAEEPIV